MDIAHALWDVGQAGLTTPGIDAELQTVHTVANDDRPAADGAATYRIAPSRYQPYISTTMPCDCRGYQMAAQALNVSRAWQLRAGLLESWAGDALRRLTSRQAAALRNENITPVAGPLARLGAVVPRKGSEAAVLWREYQRRNPDARSLEMTMRDYLGALYYWQFEHSADMGIADLFGSLLTFTLAVDFVDAEDGSGAGGHQRPDLFPDPGRFDPGRWHDNQRETLPHGAFIPFGGGARKCIGDQFGVTEAVLALATIASRWRLTSPSGKKIRAAASATLRPRHLRMRAAARRTSP